MWSCGDLRGHVSHATANAAVRVTIILRQDDEIGRRGAGRTDLGKSYPRRNPWAAQWKKGWSWPRDGKNRKNIEKNKHTALKKHSAGGKLRVLKRTNTCPFVLLRLRDHNQFQNKTKKTWINRDFFIFLGVSWWRKATYVYMPTCMWYQNVQLFLRMKSFVIINKSKLVTGDS